MHQPRRAPPGVTLPELLVLLTVLAILAGAGVQALGAAADGAAVRAAGGDLRSTLGSARVLAVRRGTRTAVRLDSASGRVAVHAGPDTLLRLALAMRYGVRLAASRESTAFTPLGLGYGAANLRAVLARGRARDTITLSRLGRIR